MSKLWRVGKEELRYVSEAVELGLSGKFNTRLEKEFSKKFGVEYAIGVNSGTSALHCCLGAIGIGKGDEVIVPSITFAAPALAALQQGATPVFADVDEETFNINPADIKKKITEKTKAIIPVSLYGLPADMDAIMEIAQENNVKVIEDNAQCVLGKYKGRLAGTIGNMSIFSFERSKHMTTGNGGMVITSDEGLAEKIRKFSILGYSTLTARGISYKDSKDKIQHPGFKRHLMAGYNYRLPELCAAMALAQLEKIDMLVSKRQEIAKLYGRALSECDWLIPQKTPDGYVHSYWTYVLRFMPEIKRVAWEDFRKRFLEFGGERYYACWSVVYLEPLFKKMGFKPGLCPAAEKIQPQLIQLKTNFESLDYAQKQAAILKKTIESF